MNYERLGAEGCFFKAVFFRFIWPGGCNYDEFFFSKQGSFRQTSFCFLNTCGTFSVLRLPDQKTLDANMSKHVPFPFTLTNLLSFRHQLWKGFQFNLVEGVGRFCPFTWCKFSSPLNLPSCITCRTHKLRGKRCLKSLLCGCCRISGTGKCLIKMMIHEHPFQEWL